jgi:hypothetical protein
VARGNSGKPKAALPMSGTVAKKRIPRPINTPRVSLWIKGRARFVQRLRKTLKQLDRLQAMSEIAPTGGSVAGKEKFDNFL